MLDRGKDRATMAGVGPKPALRAAAMGGAGLAVLLAVGLWLGCAGRGTGDGTSLPAPGRRAALASITVENRTDGRLAVGFRSATPTGRPIVIGAVDADSTALMAPVPAAEPIVLFATRDDGATFSLDARSFPLDAEWTWIIPADALFVHPDDEDGP